MYVCTEYTWWHLLAITTAFIIWWPFLLVVFRLIDGGFLVGGKKIEMKLDKKGEEEEEEVTSSGKEGKKVSEINHNIIN